MESQSIIAQFLKAVILEKMSEYLVISCSLNLKSKSYHLATVVQNEFEKLGLASELFDLRKNPLPFCDAGAAYEEPNVKSLSEKVNKAKGVLIATPVHNFNVAASTKNAIDLVGNGWKRKTVGFICTASGSRSYMSVMGVANGLMLYYRSVIIPRFVYATSPDFEGNTLKNDQVRERLSLLAKELSQYAEVHSGLVFKD